jgi:hypothetical protein
LGSSTRNIVVDNVWGDTNDVQWTGGSNVTARGCRWTNSTGGQSSVYGTHWQDAWISTTEGRISIFGNEPSSSTTDQVEITGGTPGFTSTGQVAMITVGDEVVWTMPYFALGVTGFANANPTFMATHNEAGLSFISGSQYSGFNFDFQYDTGSGFNGTWLSLNGATLSGIGAINPATGVRLKVRAYTRVAHSSNFVRFIMIHTTTTAEAQLILYPFPQPSMTINANVSLAGAEIRIYDADNTPAGTYGTELAGVESCLTPSYEYPGTVGNTIYIQILKNGYKEFVLQHTIQYETETLNITLTADKNV